MVDTPDPTELLLHPVVDRCTHWTPQVDTLNTAQFVFFTVYGGHTGHQEVFLRWTPRGFLHTMVDRWLDTTEV